MSFDHRARRPQGSPPGHTQGERAPVLGDPGCSTCAARVRCAYLLRPLGRYAGSMHTLHGPASGRSREGARHERGDTGDAWYRRARDRLHRPAWAGPLVASTCSAARSRCIPKAMPRCTPRRAWLSLCHAERGAFTEGLAMAEEGLRIAETVQNPFSLIEACSGVSTVSLRQGEVQRAIPMLERAMGLCQDWPLPLLLPGTAASPGPGVCPGGACRRGSGAGGTGGGARGRQGRIAASGDHGRLAQRSLSAG